MVVVNILVYGLSMSKYCESVGSYYYFRVILVITVFGNSFFYISQLDCMPLVFLGFC